MSAKLGGMRAGLVSFVGAGPGDPGLRTARAAQRLAEADVVFEVEVSAQTLIEQARGGKRVACLIAGDPFDPGLIGPSAGHWGRQPGEYGRLAFFTTDGGTASPPEGGPQPAKLVKVELLTEAAVR